MDSSLVETLAQQAKSALYLTPDMWLHATYFDWPSLTVVARKMHQKQTTAYSLEWFADIAYERYIELDSSEGILGILMALADLNYTRRQIRHGLMSASQMAVAIHLLTINDPDAYKFPRIIAPGLENMRIPDLAKVTVETMQRILAADPWLSWMERLRAQKVRTLRVLRTISASDICDQVREGQNSLVTRREAINKYRSIKAAQKSIRRGIDLYTQMFGVDELKVLLNSGGTGRPLLVPGVRYDYYLRKSPDTLLRCTQNVNSHITPISTAVFNKQAEHLCDVCIYFNGMPLIDHLLALKLNVSNEETEMDVLQAMNVLRVPHAFYRDPLLPDLKNIHDPYLAPTTFVHNLNYYIQSVTGPAKQRLPFPMYPLAQRAFIHVMHCGKLYFSTLARRGRTEFLTNAQALIERVQAADQAGVF